MKRFAFILLSLIIIVLTVSCSSDMPVTKLAINSVETTKLTEREKQLIAIGNDGYYTFDYRVGDQYNWVEVWVDSYEFGKKVSGGGGLSSGLSQDKAGMIVATIKEQEDQKHTWTIAQILNGSTMFNSFTLENDVNSQSCAKATQAITEPVSIDGRDEITLGSICYADQTKPVGIRPLSGEFYNNPEEHLDEIKAYDLVYLIKIKFSEKQPK